MLLLPLTTYAPAFLQFLEYYRNGPPSTSFPEFHILSKPGPEIVALQVMRSGTGGECDMADLSPMLVSVLTRILRPGDRLQSRVLGLELFAGLWRC